MYKNTKPPLISFLYVCKNILKIIGLSKGVSGRDFYIKDPFPPSHLPPHDSFHRISLIFPSLRVKPGSSGQRFKKGYKNTLKNRSTGIRKIYRISRKRDGVTMTFPSHCDKCKTVSWSDLTAILLTLRRVSPL